MGTGCNICATMRHHGVSSSVHRVPMEWRAEGRLRGLRHWATEILEAVASKDVRRCAAALDLPGADVNARFTSAGYFGPCYVGQGNMYCKGDTALHMATRERSAGLV